jgi:hypothetical protein
VISIRQFQAFDFHLQMTQNRGDEWQNSKRDGWGEGAKTSYTSIREAGRNIKFFILCTEGKEEFNDIHFIPMIKRTAFV